METIAASDVVAVQLVNDTAFAVTNQRRITVETMNAHIRGLEHNLPARTKPRLNKVLYDLVLPINGDRLPSQLGEIDLMQLARESEVDPFMAHPLLFQPFPHPSLAEKLSRSMFQHTGTDS